MSITKKAAIVVAGFIELLFMTLLCFGAVPLLSSFSIGPKNFVGNQEESIVIPGGLVGKKVHAMGAKFLGVPDGTRLDSMEVIDFSEALANMWQVKKKKNNSVANQAGIALVSEYRTNGGVSMTIQRYESHIDDVISEARNNMDWEYLQHKKVFGLSDAEIEAVRLASDILTGRDFLAYAATELMPSATDGEFNIILFDFLLQHAGRDFLESIPALYDAKTSFGLYQFTEFAVFDTPKEKRGASIVSYALPENLRIPGSVIYLRGDDHHRAAYLFAVCNIALAVRSLGPRELKTFTEEIADHHDGLVAYIATAHHLPADARRAFNDWVERKEIRDSYTAVCGKRIVGYSGKTLNNLRAL